MFPTEPVQCRVWIRGVFQLPSGKMITRTVRREYTVQPGDAERTVIQYDDLLEQLQTTGHEFREGNGVLVEILGSMTDDVPPA